MPAACRPQSHALWPQLEQCPFGDVDAGVDADGDVGSDCCRDVIV